jgi:hypothetical protein
MITTSKALQALENEHLIECYQLATQMELDADFIIQLKIEIEIRHLTGLLQQKGIPFGSKPAMILNATG